MKTTIYGDKIKTSESLKKLLEGDTYIKIGKDEVLKFINQDSCIFTYGIDSIYNEFSEIKIKKNNILIHFVGNYMLSEVTFLVNKIYNTNKISSLEFIVSSGNERFVSLYVN